MALCAKIHLLSCNSFDDMIKKEKNVVYKTNNFQTHSRACTFFELNNFIGINEH